MPLSTIGNDVIARSVGRSDQVSDGREYVSRKVCTAALARARLATGRPGVFFDIRARDLIRAGISLTRGVPAGEALRSVTMRAKTGSLVYCAMPSASANGR